MGEDESYRNPFWSGGFADPFLLKVRGRYYAYATENERDPVAGAPVFPILRSADMRTWEAAGHAMRAFGEPYFRYWAPEVTEDNGRFLLYYAVHTEPFRAAIRVAVAERPEGPFVDSGRDLTSASFAWSIDPHVFRDHDGTWYLFYTTEFMETDTGLIGTGNVVDRLIDPLTAAGAPARVTPPRHAWQLFEAKRAEKDGRDWYCVEGPAVLRHRDRYYEMYSGGCYFRDNYAVGYAVASAPIGPGGLRDDSWHDHGIDESGLLMRGSGNTLVSPGHNSVVPGPNNADLYIAYHAWPVDRSGRLPCLDRLYWHGDALWTPAPTITPQPAPALPRLRDLFDGDRLDPAWTATGGRWRLGDAEAVQEMAGATEAALAHVEPLGPAWLLEVSARRIEGDGAYGVGLGEGATVLIDPAAGVLEARAPDGPPARAALPERFRPEAMHQLVLAHSGTLLQVRLDGLPALALACPAGAAFALRTERCSAGFAGIALTDHFRDEFLDPHLDAAGLGWTTVDGGPPGAAWRIEAGALSQGEPSGERAVLKGSVPARFEAGATMRARGTGPASGAFGLLLRRGEAGDLAILLSADGRLLVEGRGDLRGVREAVDLGAGFDVGAWHTITLARRGEALAIGLDGPALLSLPLPESGYGFGLITRDAEVAFTGAWQTGYR